MKRISPCLAVLVTAMSVCVAQEPSTRAVDRSAVIGTWTLVSAETLGPDGRVTSEWMGRDPTGLIVYDATGHISVQIMRDPPPTFSAGRDRPGTPEEFTAAYQGYYAYLVCTRCVTRKL